MPLCFPDTAIWPDPEILPVEPDPVDPDNLTSEEEAEAAQYIIDLQQVEIALSLAWSTLQVLSAYQIAICPVVLRPCKATCAEGSYYIAPAVWSNGRGSFWPTVRNGQWTNIVCGHGGRDCGCSAVREMMLPGPIGGIVEVKIGTEVLDPSAYRVDNGNLLVRQDGEGWPACQDFNLPLGEEGTFSVTYYHGATADLTVRYAAGVLASEYLKAMQGGECRLPAGTTNVVRQGITIEVQANLFENGLTGIYEVDGVIMRFNPYGVKMPSKIVSLDKPRARFTTLGG